MCLTTFSASPPGSPTGTKSPCPPQIHHSLSSSSAEPSTQTPKSDLNFHSLYTPKASKCPSALFISLFLPPCPNPGIVLFLLSCCISLTHCQKSSFPFPPIPIPCYTSWLNDPSDHIDPCSKFFIAPQCAQVKEWTHRDLTYNTSMIKTVPQLQLN